MSSVPSNLKYTKDHEWALIEGNKATIGVTDHAQESLGDVVYVELPKVGSTLTQGQSFGVIESTKAVSELFAPLTGKVLKVNDELQNAPQTVNQDAYKAGWIVEIELSDKGQVDGLLDAAAYQKLLETSK
jgi:glycine cleavage system H protein